jgi:predicted thioesterase
MGRAVLGGGYEVVSDGDRSRHADGRRVTFNVKAEDSSGVAGEGTHERVLIDLARFLQRVGARQ